MLEWQQNIIIATGNTCLDGFFTRERFERLKEGNDFENGCMKIAHTGLVGKNVSLTTMAYIWDVLAAAALLNPSYFIEKAVEICPDEDSMQKGLLLGQGKKRKVVIPKIKDVDAYIEHVYEQFKIFGER